MTARAFNPADLPIHPAPHVLTAAPDGTHWQLPVSLAPDGKGPAGLVSVWPSARAMLDAVPDGALAAFVREHGAGWVGADAAAIAARATDGAPRLRDVLAPIMRRLTVDAPLETGRRARVAAVAGTAPRVAAWIAGQPRAMTRRAAATSPVAPLHVVVDATSVWIVPAGAVARRAAAIAAWVQRLSAVRPVVLWGAQYGEAIGCRGRYSLTLWRVPASLDPAQLWPIAAPECPRGIVTTLGIALRGNGAVYLKGAMTPGALAPLFAPGETVVCLPGIMGTDHAAGTFATDASTLAWLERTSAAAGLPLHVA
jgi:hypothetical protein